MSTLKRDIKYINRDFDANRKALIDFAKVYFPETYNDFNPESLGMMFIEMDSYIGDLLSFYTDNHIQENFLQNSRQIKNLYKHAYVRGYNPKVTTPAIVEIEINQEVDSVLSGGEYIPDYEQAFIIPANTTISSSLDSSIKFLTLDNVDFSFSSSYSPTLVEELIDDEKFKLTKKVKAMSARIISQTFTFGEPERFSSREIQSSNIIGVLDVVDSDGNIWYEVPNLAQDLIYEYVRNVNESEPNFYEYSDVPYILRMKKIQRRFVSRFINSSTLKLEFGSGVHTDNDEEIIPNPDNIGLGLPYERRITTAFSPTNFLFTKTYGIAPSNTTLTVRYLVGGGIESNVPSETLIGIDKSNILNTNPFHPGDLNGITCYNPQAATGGRGGDTIEDLRLNSLNTFATQLRAVTSQDYLLRALSMPPNLGTIAKAYIEPEKLHNREDGTSHALDMYILAYDYNKSLTKANEALKHNLKTYLSQYRIINDTIKIKDAFVINIGVDFDIIVRPNYTSYDVINRCINELTSYFSVENWQINQPILLKEIYLLLDKIEGVQTVSNVKIINKVGSGEEYDYSKYSYDIDEATINYIIYPSMDPMVFEVKFPNIDFRGRSVSF